MYCVVGVVPVVVVAVVVVLASEGNTGGSKVSMRALTHRDKTGCALPSTVRWHQRCARSFDDLDLVQLEGVQGLHGGELNKKTHCTTDVQAEPTV